MLQSLEYTKGNIQVKIDGHRHVLESSKVIHGVTVNESDFSNESTLIQACFTAVKDLSDRSEDIARFNSAISIIVWNEQTITPQTTGLPADIQAFVDEIYKFDPNPQGKGRFHEIHELLQLKDEPDSVVTEPKEVKVRKRGEDGKLRLVTEIQQKPVMIDEDLLDENDNVIEVVKSEKIKKGKKVSQAKKNRLAELLARTID